MLAAETAEVIGPDRLDHRCLPHGLHSARPRKVGIKQGNGDIADRDWGGWRRRRDSNPRDSFPPTPLAGERLRPLGHVSADRFIEMVCDLQGANSTDLQTVPERGESFVRSLALSLVIGCGPAKTLKRAVLHEFPKRVPRIRPERLRYPQSDIACLTVLGADQTFSGN
jgi:hypothetical protein